MSDGIWFQETNRSTTLDKLEMKESELETLKDAFYILDSVKSLLRDKNIAYGDSALNPIRLFSRADSIAALCVRIDDKLSRIKKLGVGEDAEDTIQDLIGYLVLLQVAKRKGGR